MGQPPLLKPYLAGSFTWNREGEDRMGGVGVVGLYKDLVLPISGAFGVFHRRRVVDAHGYLTRSEHYLKDTVGEDMELVVRLTRSLCESRTPFAVQYAARANCWTEIPETFRVLNRQRDRWQRGLLDIVTFHFKIMANPRYGRAGLVVDVKPEGNDFERPNYWVRDGVTVIPKGAVIPDGTVI